MEILWENSIIQEKNVKGGEDILNVKKPLRNLQNRVRKSLPNW